MFLWVTDVEMLVLLVSLIASFLCLQELQRHSAKVVVRCCEPSYDAHSLEDGGIKVVVSTTDACSCDRMSSQKCLFK